MSNDNLILEWLERYTMSDLRYQHKHLRVDHDGKLVVFDDSISGWDYVGTDLAAALKALAGEE